MNWIHLAIYLTMGSLFSMLVHSPRNQQAMQPVSPPSKEEKKVFILEEKENPIIMPGSTISPPSKKKAVTEEEKEHLLLLGTMAGSPVIVFEAVESRNILDPAHMKRAEAMNAEWERGSSLLAPYFEKQEKYDAVLEQLRKIGEGMEGKPVLLKYKEIIPRIGEVTPVDGWKLRVKIPDNDEEMNIDLGLSIDYLHDTVMDVSRYVPRFEAWIVWPDREPERLNLCDD